MNKITTKQHKIQHSRRELYESSKLSRHGCRKSVGIYVRIDEAIEESAKRKKKELLEKFVGGAK